MTTAAVAAPLVVLALIDGMLAGFRSSAGRTGLIHHRRYDLVAGARGVLLAAVLLAPVAVGVLLHGTDRYLGAGWVMLAVYLPYAALVVAALVGYLVLGWRRRFLAMAVVLGPLTFARPAVAVGGAVAGAWSSRDGAVAAVVLLAAGLLLAVGPAADRIWYARR